MGIDMARDTKIGFFGPVFTRAKVIAYNCVQGMLKKEHFGTVK